MDILFIQLILNDKIMYILYKQIVLRQWIRPIYTKETNGEKH